MHTYYENLISLSPNLVIQTVKKPQDAENSLNHKDKLILLNVQNNPKLNQIIFDYCKKYDILIIVFVTRLYLFKDCLSSYHMLNKVKYKKSTTKYLFPEIKCIPLTLLTALRQLEEANICNYFLHKIQSCKKRSYICVQMTC